MADTQTTVTLNGTTVIIYSTSERGVYYIDEIFDSTNPKTGKYFPALYSVIIKADGSLWYVSARNTASYDITLKPCNWIVTDDDDTTQVVSYGNDKFCLYQDTRVNPFKLVADAKLLFYGNNLVEYTLSRTTTNGDEEMVSMYYDAAGNFVSNRIPLASISSDKPNYKFPTNCHTTTSLTEGESVTLRVYNNLGNQAAEIVLFVRNAVWLNDLNSSTNPIVRLDAEASQMRGDDFFVYEKQDPSHINIRPYLVYADGTTKYLDVDNAQCFLYGLEYFTPSYPGYGQTLIIKYFLSARETTTSVTAKETRFLTCEKKLIVLQKVEQYSVKISVLPKFDIVSSSWKLRFFAYTTDRNHTYDVTDYVTISEEHPFDGSNLAWGTEQHVSFSYDLQEVFNVDDEVIGAQDIWITTWNPETAYARYTFRDSDRTSTVYGVESSVTRRPVLCYDSSEKRYFIPTSIFKNWDAVVEAFYTFAVPPYDAISETKAPTPTHFILRDVDNGQMIIGGAISAANYGQATNCIVGTSLLPGQTVVVEFLRQETDSSDYKILYGVPVDVIAGTYNTEAN